MDKTITNELGELLVCFSLNSDLFTDESDEAKASRERLKELLDKEKAEKSLILRAVSVIKVILQCPEIIEVRGKPGFEWVAHEFSEMLKRQSAARSYGLREEELYDQKRPKRRYRGGISRREATFIGLIGTAWQDLGRKGHPAELGRDLRRTIAVRTFQKELSVDQASAVRMLAEAEQKLESADSSQVSMEGVNVGTATRPASERMLFGIKKTLKTRSRKQSEIGTFEREILRSLSKVQKRFELREVTPKLRFIIVPIPRNSRTGNLSKKKNETDLPGTDHDKN